MRLRLQPVVRRDRRFVHLPLRDVAGVRVLRPHRWPRHSRLPAPASRVPTPDFDPVRRALPDPQGASCQSSIAIEGCYGQIEGFVSCECLNSQWACEGPSPPPCFDGGDDGPFGDDADADDGTATNQCPPRDVQLALSPCFSPGQICPGDPTDCDGERFYDALQCINDQWTPVATTVCPEGPDGGIEEAGAADAIFLDGP